MGTKNLLNENTIRRFMKLANVNALTNGFVNERFPTEVEEELTEQDDFEVEEEEEAEAPVVDDADLGGEDLGDLDVDEEAPMGDADMSLTEEEAELLISLGERLKEAMAGADEEEAPEEEPEVGVEEPAMDLGGDVDPAAADEEEAGPPANRMYENKESVINEILKRVTKRIVSERIKRSG